MSPLRLIFSTGHLSLLRVMTKVFCLCYSGGSVVKIVYRSKANLDEAESNVSCYIGHQPSLRITFSAKGARRQVQDGTLAPPWILLFSFLQTTIHAHYCTESDTEKLPTLSTE